MKIKDDSIKPVCRFNQINPGDVFFIIDETAKYPYAEMSTIILKYPFVKIKLLNNDDTDKNAFDLEFYNLRHFDDNTLVFKADGYLTISNLTKL